MSWQYSLYKLYLDDIISVSIKLKAFCQAAFILLLFQDCIGAGMCAYEEQVRLIFMIIYCQVFSPLNYCTSIIDLSAEFFECFVFFIILLTNYFNKFCVGVSSRC